MNDQLMIEDLWYSDFDNGLVQWIDYSYSCELTGRENSKFYLNAWLP